MIRPRGFLKWFFLSVPWITLAGVLLFFFFLRFPLSGTKSFTSNFQTSNPWIDRLLPVERVTSTEGSRDGQRIIQDPIYLNVRTPGIFDRVHIVLEVRLTDQSIFGIGLLRNPATYAVELHHDPLEPIGGGWMRVRSSFVLSEASEHLKFVLSVPGLQDHSGWVDVRKIDLMYERPPLSWTRLWTDVRRELRAGGKRFKMRWRGETNL